MPLKLKKKPKLSPEQPDIQEEVEINAGPTPEEEAEAFWTQLSDTSADTPDVSTLSSAAMELVVEKAIDERGTVLAEEAAMKARQKVLTAQKNLTESLLLNLPAVQEMGAEETMDLTTDRFAVTVGKIGTSRSVTDEGKGILKDLLTEADFTSLATFKVTDMDKYLSKADRDKVMETKLTKRSVSIKALAEKS